MYNCYLRLCGAQIGKNVRIYTTLIDAPDLLNINDSTFISSDVVLNGLSYQDTTYELNSVHIGSNCSVGDCSVLYNGVSIQDNVYVKSMSSVNGYIPSNTLSHGQQICLNEQLSSSVDQTNLMFQQQVYQFVCILLIVCLNSVSVIITYLIYCQFLCKIYVWISLPVCWMIWSFLCILFVLIVLKFVIGHVPPGSYPLNSWYYIHKIWFRRLIVSSFSYSFAILEGFHSFNCAILRWLGAKIEEGNNIMIGRFIYSLHCPSNLLTIKDGISAFDEVRFIASDILNGKCVVNRITINKDAQLGNYCLIHSGSNVPAHSVIATMTRFTSETVCKDGDILLGLPARVMPFVSPPVDQMKINVNGEIFTFFLTQLVAKFTFVLFGLFCMYFVSNIFILILLFIILYSILLCLCDRLCTAQMSKPGTYSFDNIVGWKRRIVVRMFRDYMVLIGQFIGGTQWLIYFFRALGSKIGHDVLISDIGNLADHRFITIDNHVRIKSPAFSIQVCGNFMKVLRKCM
ncbi:unnamed protein product [Didymodactylos carnosus]|uniref:Uncharacterized protein n=1 Tax=Didymodactylos carnosus TaxID=1234261 RepID=A0A816A2N4_9BILA|nr:unnamed protein product [Didymodactylos carnosus]CAF4464517.1 unnamed protein product [Didymodactylos carnosus]